MSGDTLSEFHLRRIVRRHLALKAPPGPPSRFFGGWWIEPGAGSSNGLPDLVLALGGGKVAMVELKRMRYTRRGLAYALRASQVEVIRKALAGGIPYIVIGSVAAEGFPLKTIDQPVLLAERVEIRRGQAPIENGMRRVALSAMKVVPRHDQLKAAIKRLAA